MYYVTKKTYLKDEFIVVLTENERTAVEICATLNHRYPNDIPACVDIRFNRYEDRSYIFVDYDLLEDQKHEWNSVEYLRSFIAHGADIAVELVATLSDAEKYFHVYVGCNMETVVCIDEYVVVALEACARKQLRLQVPPRKDGCWCVPQEAIYLDASDQAVRYVSEYDIVAMLSRALYGESNALRKTSVFGPSEIDRFDYVVVIRSGHHYASSIVKILGPYTKRDAIQFAKTYVGEGSATWWKMCHDRNLVNERNRGVPMYN